MFEDYEMTQYNASGISVWKSWMEPFKKDFFLNGKEPWFRKSILFCKYLRNGSLDLYEIWNLSSLGRYLPINIKHPCVRLRKCAQIFINIYL